MDFVKGKDLTAAARCSKLSEYVKWIDLTAGGTEVNQIAEESLLFDFYGSLLTEKKQRVMRLYHEENMSLSEIAQDCEISRAAVYDSLKKAEAQLKDYEERLGLVQAYFKRLGLLSEVRSRLERLGETIGSEDAEASEILKDVQRSLDALSEEE